MFIYLASLPMFFQGIGFISMSTPPVTGTCKQFKAECIGPPQKGLFYAGMALLAVGMAGHLVSVRPFLDDQQDRPDDHNNATINCLKLPGFTIVVLIPLVGAIALPYIKPWSIRFGIPAICTLVATILFLTGWRTYDKAEPQGSPLTCVCRVFVSFAFKKSQSFPLNARQLYKRDEQELLTRTRFLRFVFELVKG